MHSVSRIATSAEVEPILLGLRGLACSELTGGISSTWVFKFGDDVTLTLDAPWRILEHGVIKLGHEDHGQWFGNSEPVDGISKGMKLLTGRSVLSVAVKERPGDLLVRFGDDTLLEVFVNSSGYESWTLVSQHTYLVAMGGGQLAIGAFSSGSD